MISERNLVIEVIYAPLVGGSETLAFALCKQWKAQGVAVRICCLYEKQGALIALFEEAGIAYDLLDIGGKSWLQRWLRVARYFWKLKPRVIHAHHLGTLVNVLVPAYITGCTYVVYTEHSSLEICKTEWMRRVIPLASRLVKKVTCVSNTLVEFFAKELGVPSNKLVAIYNGVDTTKFKPGTVSDRARSKIRIGAVGRLVEEKDYPTLLRALALLKALGVRFEAEIIGDGPLACDLHSLAKELQITDVLLFRGHRQDIPELLRELDIYVLCSQSEGMPIAVLEAMATGLPVVATNVDAVPEVVKHNVNGILVEKGDPCALADAVQGLICDPVLRQRLGSLGLQDVGAAFSINNTTRIYAEHLGIA